MHRIEGSHLMHKKPATTSTKATKKRSKRCAKEMFFVVVCCVPCYWCARARETNNNWIRESTKISLYFLHLYLKNGSRIEWVFLCVLFLCLCLSSTTESYLLGETMTRWINKDYRFSCAHRKSFPLKLSNGLPFLAPRVHWFLPHRCAEVATDADDTTDHLMQRTTNKDGEIKRRKYAFYRDQIRNDAVDTHSDWNEALPLSIN